MDKVLFRRNEENGMFLLSAAEIRGWKILLQDWNTEQPNSIKGQALIELGCSHSSSSFYDLLVFVRHLHSPVFNG